MLWQCDIRVRRRYYFLISNTPSGIVAKFLKTWWFPVQYYPTSITTSPLEKLHWKDIDEILYDSKRVCGKLGKTDVGRIIIFVGTSSPPSFPRQEILVSCPSLLRIKPLPLVYHIIHQIITWYVKNIKINIGRKAKLVKFPLHQTWLTMSSPWSSLWN